MQAISDFYSKSEEYAEAINAFVREHHLQGVALADHLGFKCESREVFEAMRAMLEPESKYLYQSYISGRRISIIALKRPIETLLGPISILELSDQKPDNSQVTRFDHVEIFPLDKNYDALVDILTRQGVIFEEVIRPHHTTHDFALEDGFKIKLTREPLIEKIKREEMF